MLHNPTRFNSTNTFKYLNPLFEFYIFNLPLFPSDFFFPFFHSFFFHSQFWFWCCFIYLSTMSVATYKIPRNLNEWVIFRQSVRSQFHYDNSRRTNAIFSVFLVLAVLGVILFGLSFYKRTRSNLKRLYTIDSQGYIHVQSHYTPLVAVLYGTRT